jgi:hypothetical protein
LANFGNLRQLGIYDRVKLHSAAVTDFRSVVQPSGAIETTGFAPRQRSVRHGCRVLPAAE